MSQAHYSKDLSKVCSRSNLKPALAGVYFGDHVQAATDSYKVVEAKTESKLNVIVDRKVLKNGDTIVDQENGKVAIVRKDGSTLETKALNGDEFPRYQTLFDEAEKRGGTHVRMTRMHLIEALQAMPDVFIDVTVPVEAYKPMLIVGEVSRALVMPVNK